MARPLALLRYQLIAYWRGAFAIRGVYDAGSGFLLLVLLASAFRFVTLLRDTANSVANGDSAGLDLLLAIVLLSWTLPALETQRFSSMTSKLGHLPVKRTELALINIASVFLLPMSVLSAVISIAAIYPFLYSPHAAAGIASIVVFALFSAMANAAIVNMLSLRSGRIIFLLVLGALGVLIFTSSAGLAAMAAEVQRLTIHSFLLPSGMSMVWLSLALIGAFLVGLLCARGPISQRIRSSKTSNVSLSSKIKIPLKYGELIKKDLLFSWKTLDYWMCLIAAILYAILLIAADFSFRGFGPVLAVIVSLSAGLAFNIFGVESSSAIERLSLFPVKPEDLLITKHKTFALVVFSATFFLFPVVLFKFGPVLMCAALIKAASLILLYTAWGNHLSIEHPFEMRQYQVSFGGSWGAMLYGIVFITLLAAAPEMLAAEGEGLQLMMNIVLAGLAWAGYRFSLRRNAPRMSENWRTIAVKLS